MYTVDQNEQLVIFVASLGVGFILGIIYDLFRTVRLSLTRSKVAVVIFDLLYFSLFAFLSFIFMLVANKGEVRSYIIIGEFIGCVFYYFSFGISVIKVTDRFIAVLRRFYSFLFKVVSAPFRLLKKAFLSFFTKISLFFKKSKKKSKKMRKKLLPKVRLFVYNLFGILCASRINSQKGRDTFGSEEK